VDREADLTTDACYQAFQAHYTVAQYHWVQFATEWLTECSRTFDGDLQMMLILSVVGQRQLDERRRNPGAVVEQLVPTITASRIADLTGIPRETVRRKLEAMAKRGWVRQNAEAAWSIAVVDGRIPVREALSGLEDNAMRKISRFVANFMPLVRKHQDF
jgi:hypothetical protein